MLQVTITQGVKAKANSMKDNNQQQQKGKDLRVI